MPVLFDKIFYKLDCPIGQLFCINISLPCLKILKCLTPYKKIMFDIL